MRTETSAELLTRLRRRADDLTAENYCLRHADRPPPMKNYLLGTLGVCALALTGFGCYALLAVHNTVAAVPGEIQATRTALVAEVDAQSTGIRKDATAQLNAIRTQSLTRVDALSTDLKNSINHINITLESAVHKADEQLTGLRAEIAPVLVDAALLATNAAALTKDAQDSLDDLYPDLRGLTESATVATTQTAQTMETVRAAAPEIAAATVSVGKSVTVIADSAATEAKKFAAPMSKREKIMLWLQLVPRLALKLL